MLQHSTLGQIHSTRRGATWGAPGKSAAEAGRTVTGRPPCTRNPGGAPSESRPTMKGRRQPLKPRGGGKGSPPGGADGWEAGGDAEGFGAPRCPAPRSDRRRAGCARARRRERSGGLRRAVGWRTTLAISPLPVAWRGGVCGGNRSAVPSRRFPPQRVRRVAGVPRWLEGRIPPDFREEGGTRTGRGCPALCSWSSPQRVERVTGVPCWSPGRSARRFLLFVLFQKIAAQSAPARRLCGMSG